MTNLQERIIGTALANTITNFAVTTTLVPSDVVVVCCSRGAGSPATTITTAGVTWTSIFNSAANTRAQAHRATGITGPINVAVRVFAPIDDSRTVIYVIRGLADPAVYALTQSTWDNTAGDDLTPSQVFGTDQFAIGECIGTNPATATFPTGTPPAAGWTIDDVYTAHPPLFMSHAIGATSESTNLTVGISNGGNNNGAALMVFGPPPPAPPTTVPDNGRWGIQI